MPGHWRENAGVRSFAIGCQWGDGQTTDLTKLCSPGLQNASPCVGRGVGLGTVYLAPGPDSVFHNW